MSSLYTKPLRIYVILGALALWGIISGLSLPISLFPNSSEVRIAVTVPYGSYSNQQFFEVYGQSLESKLQGLKVNSIPVTELTAEYRNQTVRYDVKFAWGAEPTKALSDTSALVSTHFASANLDIQRGIDIGTRNDNKGFFAVSFYSPLRSLDDLYQILDPLINPLKSQIEDAGSFNIYNPNEKEVSISLYPSKLAQYELNPLQVQRAVQAQLIGLNGGTIKMGEKNYLIELPKTVLDIQNLSLIRVSAPGKAPIFLKDIAKITSGASKNGWTKFKTSGVESLILFASPKEGGNIKRMSDQILEQMKLLEKEWPTDIQYKILVNPSEFINSSIQSVIHEVLLAALLAVIVLFLFIGSFRNVITAAIEIPLSLLMAFILMKMAGMNLNMISLGGLALSAGMNVDASVVVLENIVRHFEGKPNGLSYQEKVKLLINAVNEVRLPIIASTIASLVVFLPLVFTNGLTNALLGDLAKAVIFSHGLSAIVALVLVPTIRLQLLSAGQNLESHSPLNKVLNFIENFYRHTLSYFLNHRGLQKIVFGGMLVLLPLLIYLVLPKLETEIIGKPESDWLMVGINSPSFTKLKQMESDLDILEESLNQNFGKDILYTFTQINGPNNGIIMLRVRNKKDIFKIQERAEEIYKNTTTKFYWVDYWNPSELSIPDPPQYRVEIVGGDPLKRSIISQDFQGLLLEKGLYDKVKIDRNFGREKQIVFKPYSSAVGNTEVLSRDEISHFLRVVTEGVYVDQIQNNRQALPIYLRWEEPEINSIEALKSIPVGFEGRMIPLGALAQISIEDRNPRIYRENQRALYVVTGSLNKAQLPNKKEKALLASEALRQFKAQVMSSAGTTAATGMTGATAATGMIATNLPSITEVPADIELRTALDQLNWAVVISILLIFLTMIIQLGDVIHSLLVLVAIPLGFIGVLISLFLFKSTLSLNSGLGTILLNGIAVANSIILVDFIKKLFDSGKSAKDATLEAAVTRLRPILMTSLTTVLGMLPVALGFGEGGKILQPLGIAVCGGLWISMLLTLYFVPTLQFLYLSRKEVKK